MPARSAWSNAARLHRLPQLETTASRHVPSSRYHRSSTADAGRHRRSDELFDPGHSDKWWSQTGSNRRPHACKARALPTELWPRREWRTLRSMVGLGRLERPTSPLSGVRSNHLSYRPETAATQTGRDRGGTQARAMSRRKEKRRRRRPANGP